MLETQKGLPKFPNFARKSKSYCLHSQAPLAFRQRLSALIGKIATMGNGPIGRVQKNLSFVAKWFDHPALLCLAGGSAIGLSATDAYGQSLGR
jgi:hypothetical protein